MMQKIRCAIYTRKSSEDGLEQDFNSLDAQYEACAAFITSQKAEGWTLVKERFDDGGLSGGTLERPALHRLMAEIDAGRIDRIVVYKIDRLTGSLTDFAKIVDRLDAVEASFVSVTQSFNTATSMGRLTLNMLLSFAQFEREVTAERIRDKIAASKKKGLWMGGSVPMGYAADGRTLAVEEADASVIRTLYDLYQQHRSVREVAAQAEALNLRTAKRTARDGTPKGNKSFTRQHIHAILSNPIYTGRIRHKGTIYDGRHPELIDPETWAVVQTLLQTDAARDRGTPNQARPSLLASKLYDDTGDRLTPSHTQKNGKRLRYYISRRLVVGQAKDHPDAWRLPAIEFEQALAREIHAHLSEETALAKLLPTRSASDLQRVRTPFEAALKGLQSETPLPLLASMIRKVRLGTGEVTITLDPDWFMQVTDLSPVHLNHEAMTLIRPFHLRRRGVETKVILGAIPAERDETLIANIRKAQNWYCKVIAGQRFGDISADEGFERSRLQHMIGLAFLAPDIVERVANGTGPIALTSEWVKRNAIPQDWAEQRAVFDAL